MPSFFFHRLCATFAALLVSLSATHTLAEIQADAAAPPQIKAFDQVASALRASAYGVLMSDAEWNILVDKHRPSLRRPPSNGDQYESLDFAARNLIHEATGSASFWLTSDDQTYWALLSMFSGELTSHKLRHSGAWFEHRGARWYVRNVFPGSPAAVAGLRRGDEIIQVDGVALQPVQSFAQLRPAQQAKVVYKRQPWDQPHVAIVGTVVESFQESLLRAMKASLKTYTAGTRTLTYIWLPAATHPGFREVLHNVARQAQANSDAMILDLRDNFGDGDLTYLEAFLDIPQVSEDKPGTSKVTKAIYSKPLVVLVNRGTRGGREWLARAIQRQKRGVLIGERTAGSFIANRLVDIIVQRFALLLPERPADSNSRLSAQLQGQGLTPDIIVDAPLPYAGGVDVQLNRGISHFL